MADSVSLQHPLPAQFTMRLPDDALAPEFPKGVELVWARDKAPQLGNVVLTRDQYGDARARRHSGDNDAAQVLAVAIWAPMP